MATASGGSGRKGTTKSSVNSSFETQITSLQTQAKIDHNALQGKHQSMWYYPDTVSESLLDPIKITEQLFDRTDINEQYAAATNNPQDAGTVGDVISLKLQNDYVASAERAFRARHTSIARASCLAAGRRFGQGHGRLFTDNPGGLQYAVSRYIAAGGQNIG